MPGQIPPEQIPHYVNVAAMTDAGRVRKRNEDAFVDNPRMGQQLAGMRRLNDLPEVRARAIEVLDALDAGTL